MTTTTLKTSQRNRKRKSDPVTASRSQAATGGMLFYSGLELAAQAVLAAIDFSHLSPYGRDAESD